MKFASQTLWWGIKEGFFQLTRLILLNFLWILFCLPIITIPAATLSLASTIRVMVIDETNFKWQLFFEGLRRYFISGWRWFLPNLILPSIFIYNILFFAVESYRLSIFIQAANIVMLFIWFFIQTFTLPFLVEDEVPVMRNGLLKSVRLLYQKPGLYWLVSFFLFIFFTLSFLIVFPIILFSVSLSLFITIYCLQVVLGRRGMIPEEESSKVG
jgi:uncharacterized membrane protein YesL